MADKERRLKTQKTQRRNRAACCGKLISFGVWCLSLGVGSGIGRSRCF